MHTHTLRSLHWTDLERHVKSRERTRRECTRTDCATSTPPTWLTPLTAANSWRSNPAPSRARCTLAVISLQTAIHDACCVVRGVRWKASGWSQSPSLLLVRPRRDGFVSRGWETSVWLTGLLYFPWSVCAVSIMKVISVQTEQRTHTYTSRQQDTGFLWWR